MTTETSADADHISSQGNIGALLLNTRGCKEWKERDEEVMVLPEIVTRRSDSPMEKSRKDVPGHAFPSTFLGAWRWRVVDAT